MPGLRQLLRNPWVLCGLVIVLALVCIRAWVLLVPWQERPLWFARTRTVVVPFSPTWDFVQLPSPPLSQKPYPIRQTVTNLRSDTVIVFSSNDRWMASAGSDYAIRIRDVHSGAVTQILAGCVSPIIALAISADGHWVASSEQDGMLRLWDARSGSCRWHVCEVARPQASHRTITQQFASTPATALVFTADEALRCGYNAVTLHMFASIPEQMVGFTITDRIQLPALVTRDITTGAVLSFIPYNENARIWFSPDGHATAAWGSQGLIVRTDDGDTLRLPVYSSKSHRGNGICFSRNNTHIVVYQYEPKHGKTSIQAWEIPSGTQVLRTTSADHYRPITQMAFESDDRMIACQQKYVASGHLTYQFNHINLRNALQWVDRDIEMLNYRSDSKVNKPSDAVSPHGSYFVYSENTGSTMIDLRGYQHLWFETRYPVADITALHVTPHGAGLLVAADPMARDESVTTYWNVDTGVPERVMKKSVSNTFTGEWLSVVTSHNFNSKTPQVLNLHRGWSAPDGRRMLDIDEKNERFHLFDTVSGALVNSVAAKTPTEYSSTETATHHFSSDGTLLAIYDPGQRRIMIVDTQTGKERRSIAIGDADRCYGFTADHRSVILGTPHEQHAVGSEVTLMSVSTGKSALRYPLPTTMTRHLYFSPDGKQCIAPRADADSEVYLFAAGSPQRIPDAGIDPAETAPFACAFSPDGQRLATTALHSPPVIRDTRTMAPLASLPGCVMPVTAMTFSADGRRLYTAGGGMVQVWDSAGHLRATLMVITGQSRIFGKDDLLAWIVFTPDGYHHGSPGAEQYLRWRRGEQLLTATELGPSYRNPAKIGAALGASK